MSDYPGFFVKRVEQFLSVSEVDRDKYLEREDVYVYLNDTPLQVLLLSPTQAECTTNGQDPLAIDAGAAPVCVVLAMYRAVVMDTLVGRIKSMLLRPDQILLIEVEKSLL